MRSIATPVQRRSGAFSTAPTPANFDMASYGVVKVLEGRHGHPYPDMAWEPKAAFAALADY